MKPACGTVLDDHLASVLVVQTTMFRSPRRLAEVLLLCLTQDRVLVRGASMGRESGGVRLPECDDIWNGFGEACTLLPGVNSPAPAGLSQKSGDIASAERAGEAVELLADS